MTKTELRGRLIPWWPEIAVGVFAALLALLALFRAALYGVEAWDFLILGLVGASAVAFRRAPGLALGLAWAALLAHLLSLGLGLGVYPQPAEVVIAVTAFGTARYGSRAVLILSGLSIPCALVLSLVGSAVIGYEFTPGMMANAQMGFASVPLLSIPTAFVLLLAIPWLVGLVLRSRATAADSEQAAVLARTGEQQARIEREQAQVEREQAQEIAQLRADQTRLTREVHDVVGHSLAVILAQAESAQFLTGTSDTELRRVLADVAGSARQSLQDVRAVLGATRDGERAPVQSTGGMESLVDGVRAAGYEVESTVVGTPRPLPPERDAVAFRVLQEMLTNALKHGTRQQPVIVERHWDGDLRIEVRNACADLDLTEPLASPLPDQPFDGTGVEGMRRRLESVGGRLDVRRRSALDGSGHQTYTATAWLPLQS